MLCNLHTHSTFCDGKNTPEEIVLSAIEQGFHSLGFSGHGFTSFDMQYCMKDTAGYMIEVNRLKEKYQREIQIYLGVEEDAFHPVKRQDFEYIIGSSHYYCIDGKYYPIDSNFDCFKKCMALFQSDPIKMARAYYEPFCDYILKRKPDIVGHFDLITKFDQLEKSVFLENPEYKKEAEKFIKIAAKTGCLFEVNTGAISRGFRTSPYPQENLLHVLKKNGNGIVITSDSHEIATLSAYFEDAKALLRDIGFTHSYILYNGKFTKEVL